MDGAVLRIHTLRLAFPDGHHEDVDDFVVADGETLQEAHERICRVRGASRVDYRASGFAAVPVERALRAD